MVKAGAPVDEVIDELMPHLEEGDIIIDGGNSLFTDTARRHQTCEGKKIRFVGMGVSGGEEGALEGPSMMPGGDREAWDRIAPMLTKMAAQVDGVPCCVYVGPQGAGHYVKMVHNGIEYADMQLIAEAYDLMKSVYGLGAPAMAEIFLNWKQGDLDSYLIEITAAVLRKTDSAGKPLVDAILDEAEQKGTGRWTAQNALELGVPLTAITEAVYARVLSANRAMRLTMEKKTPHPAPTKRKPEKAEIDAIRDALYASKIVAYAQGFEQMSVASAQFKWDLKLGDMATIWRGGCIIRAKFLDRIKEAYERNPKLANLSSTTISCSAVTRTGGALAAGDRACGRKRGSDAGIFVVARLLRRPQTRPRAGEPAAGPARLFRRPYLPPPRQGGQLPYPLEPGRQRGEGLSNGFTAAMRVRRPRVQLPIDMPGWAPSVRLGNITFGPSVVPPLLAPTKLGQT